MAEAQTPDLKVLRVSPSDTNMRAAQMKSGLQHYFEVSVLLLLTAGFVTIATTGALDFAAVACVSLALVVRGWFLLARRQLSMPNSWDSYFTFGYVLFYAADYFLISRSFVNATVHLVLFSMVVKIFSVRRDRDYVYLTVLAFMEVLAASVLTVDTTFLAAFTIFALLAVNTFVAFEIRRSWTKSTMRPRSTASKSTDAYGGGRFSRALSAATFALLIGIVIVASGIFFVLPRITAGYFNRFAPKNRIESGFSENVQLGQIGEIQQSSAVVMHVQIYGDRTGTHDLKWRGVALSSFDGRQWLNPLPRSQAKAELAGCFNVRGDEVRGDEKAQGHLACASPVARNSGRIRYRVLMEPIGTNVFFLAPLPESVSGNYREMTVDTAGAVYNADSNHSIGWYEAISDISHPSAEALRSAATAYPGGVALRYLQLPRIDSRIPQLAKRVTADATNPYDKAVAIEQYLQNSFEYTLKLSQSPPSDPLAEFLFERKAGHCEYFASAMAVMLRTLGIPSRIVNGFRGGEFNEISGKYILRARDAHSWVEVYFPGHGWVAFDPTPAGLSPTAVQHNRLALYMDAMRDFWREWIINYDFGRQNELGNTGMTRSLKTMDDVSKWVRLRYFQLLRRGFDMHDSVVRHRRRWGYSVAALTITILLLVNLGRMRRVLLEFRLTRNPETAPIESSSVLYRKMIRTLSRRGYPKSPTATPTEFLAQISDPALRTVVKSFVTHYERARFAGSVADAAELPGLYEAVRTAARRRQPIPATPDVV